MAVKFSDDVIRAVLIIGNELKEPEKTSKFGDLLVFLMGRDDLNAREADEIKDFQQLFGTLKEKDKIRPGKMEPLLKGLEVIERRDLQRLLQDACDGIVREEYESKKPQTNKPQTARDLSQLFSIVVAHVGRDWRFLGRRLNLCQFDFDQIVEQHPRNLREQIHAMLELWKERNGTEATEASLMAALRN